MAILNTDTQTSPGIGVLPDGMGFSPLGGCIIDMVGLNAARFTAQISTSRMFYGWTSPAGPNATGPYPPNAWLPITTETFDPSNLAALLGGGVAAANIRLTLYDGDSGSPNPVYIVMFGAGRFPYARWSPQIATYDFDGGQNLWIGFTDANGTPVNCGYMGETASYRLSASDFSTLDTFNGFPGVFALTDPTYAGVPKPSRYLPAFAVTGWFSVPSGSLAAFYTVLLTGRLVIGVHDITPGDQFYDFMQGLAEDVVNIPLIPALRPPPTIGCGIPSAGVPGQPYSYRLPYTVSTEGFTLRITGGSLPPGLTMSGLGYITGTPTATGTFTFTATITDSDAQAVSATCSILIRLPGGTGNVAF